MNYPFLQFFVRDYLSDPKLSLCSPATRGIWMDWLCVMHINDRSGVITGTLEQLARVGRCLPVDAASAVAELDQTGTADVMDRNGVVTLICRRMKRDAEARKRNNLRVKNHRDKKTVTPNETPSSGYGDGSGSSPPGVGGDGEGVSALGASPPLSEVLTECSMRAIPAECGEAFWNAMEGCGWIDRAMRPVVQWRPVLRNYAMTWRANAHQASQGHGNGQGANGKPRTIHELRTVMEAKTRLADELKKRWTSETATGVQWNDQQKLEMFRNLKKEITALNEQLAKSA